MDKFPLLWNGKPLGELTTERETLYTWFAARCRLPGKGLWCAWAVGTRGELRIGVLEPAGDQAVIRRRFSDRMTSPMGKLLRAELRPASSEAAAWESLPEPERSFHTPWLKKQLRGTEGVLLRREGNFLSLALPFDKGKAFPLTAIFCFAQIRCIRGQTYAVYIFDEKEWPIFPGEP